MVFWLFNPSCRGVWQLSGTPLDVHDPRLLSIAEAERQLFEADDDYNGTNNSGAAFCRSAILIVSLYSESFAIAISHLLLVSCSLSI